MTYDRSDLIPFTATVNKSTLSPSSYGKGINLLVVHGTADTNIHPQHSMMLARGVMQQQQQQYVPTGHGSSSGRRNSNSTPSGGRAAGGFSTRTGAIRISQLVMPDADLSNSRMITGIENGSPIDHHHQLLHSVYSHVTQYLATECFTGVGDGIRGRGVRIRGRRLRKRRRRRWRTSNRDQDKAADPKHQQREETHQQYQQNQRSVSNGDSNGSNAGDYDGNNPNTGGRYRRHDIDSSQYTLNGRVKDHIEVRQIKSDSHGSSDNNKTNSYYWGNNILGNHNSSNISNKNRSNNVSKGRKKYDDEDTEDDDEEDNENEDSDQEYEDENDSDDEDEDDDDNDKDDDK